MALVQSFEKQGNFLFKYRGQFPILLFILAIPFICVTDYSTLPSDTISFYMYSAIFLSLLGFFIRFYTIGTTPKGTSGRNTKKQVADELNYSGMYSMLRHPLYLGNFLIWLGIAVSIVNLYFIVIMSLLFWLYYERIMFAEERFLERKFGVQYLDWSNKVPAFIPSIFNFKKSITPFSIITILRREYSSLLACVIGFTYIDIFKNYVREGSWKINALTLYILLGMLLVALILRSLKHYTGLLNQGDRS
ncbi:isoprenylcysteine carboxylmethyltransferase family protein [Flavobacteriales bacterium]|nr:isoprenylcysteine carboxylmethyltransferase family protein [Flavobacteriales bacterium]